MESKEISLSKEQFGLYETDIQKIKDVFEQFSDVEKVLVYGSRAKGNFKKYSDIDFSLFGANLNTKILFAIEISLDDAMLPYQFDLNIYQKITNADLLDHIERVGKVFYEKKLD